MDKPAYCVIGITPYLEKLSIFAHAHGQGTVPRKEERNEREEDEIRSIGEVRSDADSHSTAFLFFLPKNTTRFGLSHVDTHTLVQ
jgi:hypothetical protein